MAWLRSVRASYPMRYTCTGCSFTADVVVSGRGFSSGATPNAALDRRAHDSAMKNALMRCELAPCPRCGRRRFDAFRREWIRTAVLLLLLFGPGVAAVRWVSDPRSFSHNLGDYVSILLAGNALIQALVAVGFALEYRSARDAVLFPGAA